MISPVTLATTIPEAARRFGAGPAVVAADGWALSFEALDRLSDEVAAALAARGIGDGDLVALALPSVPDYVVAYGALAKLGAITTGVNPRFTPTERAALVDVAQPALVIATADMLEGLPASTPIVTTTRATDADEVFAELRAGFAGASPPPLADPDDPERLVAVIFTSGTTGRPKGAMFGNRELAAITAADVGDRWGGGEPMLVSTQFSHIGFMTKLPWYLRLATRLHLIDRWRAGDVLRIVAEQRITTIGSVAPQMALMLRTPELDQLDLSCVQAVIAGGAASPPALVAEVKARFGAAYSIRYSSTESGGVGTGTAFDAGDEEALHTIGRARPPVEAEVRDDEDRPVGPGTVGELCLRSPCMMRGYWRDPDATAVALRDGWLHTGDLAHVDDEGCLRLDGRRSDLFIRGGYNVYPLEVEAVLGEHPLVREVAVVPREDPVMGEIGVAVVVPSGQEAPTLASLVELGRRHLASYKLPEALELVDELPLTTMQKVDRRALRDRFGGTGRAG